MVYAHVPMHPLFILTDIERTIKIFLLSGINLSSIQRLIARSDIETSMHIRFAPRCTISGTLHQFQLRFINADLQRVVRSRAKRSH